jgi:hypothetical protein
MVYCAATGSQYQVYMKLCLVSACVAVDGGLVCCVFRLAR